MDNPKIKLIAVSSISLFIFVVGVLSITQVGSTTPTLTLTCSKDSCVLGGSVNLNEGANPKIRLQASGNNRGLVAFDMTGVTTDDLYQATLKLTINDDDPPSNWGASGRYVDVHRLTEDWSEGNGKNFDLPSSEQTRGEGPGVTWKCAT